MLKNLGFDIEFPLAFDDAVGRGVGIPRTDGGFSASHRRGEEAIRQ